MIPQEKKYHEKKKEKIKATRVLQEPRVAPVTIKPCLLHLIQKVDIYILTFEIPGYIYRKSNKNMDRYIYKKIVS